MKRIGMMTAVFMLCVCAVPYALVGGYDLGDEAQEISLIQEALEELDFYYADITGRYGTRTKAAVRKFQRRYGLPQTGVADQDTLELLYQKAEMDVPESMTAKEGFAAYGSAALREGSRGDSVRMLQENLTMLDFYSGSITGSYGRLTKEAVRQFQKENDLSADGVAGPRTFKKLTQLLEGENEKEEPVFSALNASVSAVQSVSLEDVDLLNTEWTLRRTSRSGYVKRLQKALAALSYDPGIADGRFGEKTENAVKCYQTARGLSSDGIAGRATLRQINEDIKDGITAENAGID